MARTTRTWHSEKRPASWKIISTYRYNYFNLNQQVAAVVSHGNLQHPTPEDQRTRPWPRFRHRAGPVLSVRAREFRRRIVTIVEVLALLPFGDTSILTIYIYIVKLDTVSIDRTNRKYISWCESYTSLSNKALTQSDKNKQWDFSFSSFLRHVSAHPGDVTSSL